MTETVISLQARDLKKTYAGASVVDGLSFCLTPGVCFGLLGPNGAGKTTTLKLCLGLATPDSGSITLAGRPIPAEAQAARARVGVVPQFDNLDPDFSVTENLLVFGRYFGMKTAEIRARIPWLLHFSGLENKADARIATLSGGMKRRLTLARALVNDPDILFLDEPTTGLDPQARHLIWERLKALKTAGKTLILTTHFMDEAERLCDALIILDHGRKIAEGSPRELIARHIEPQVVEVCDEAAGTLRAFVEAWRHSSVRVEISGETAFFYCHDPQNLLAALANAGDLRYAHRASNLEDVFIKLTGRELRD
jgi:lipooligosaccharide transport system ATP-binding protein